VLYGLESGTVSSYSFGRQFFDLSVINPNTTAINSGTLMFRNCQVIRDLFWRIMAHVDRYVGQPPACMDQPFINYHAIKDGIYDNQWLNPHVSLYEDCDPVTNYETSSICHFSFPIGNWSHKFGRMAAFFKGLLLHKTEGASVEEKQLSWGKDGWIRFESDGRLVTMWGIGTYECLGDTRILAVWHDHHHVLQKMDNGAYCSIRIQPLDFSTVVCKSSNLIIYGNSHARSLFYNCKLPCINYWKYSITMHRIGRDNTIIDFQKSDPTAIFCLVYGEVDVRCHIGKQVALGRSVDEICQTLTDAYFRTIKNTIVEYRAIVVIGVPPPVDPIDHSHTHESGQDIPFIGSNEERVLYTRTLNACLKKACVEYGYTFFAHYDYCTRADGCLDYSFADGCIHIGKTEPFLEAFYALRL
jgi:hypothetical protein